MYTLVYIRNKELRLAYTLVINQLYYWWCSDKYKDLYTKTYRGGSLVSDSTVKHLAGINYIGRDSYIDACTRIDGSRHINYFVHNDPTSYDPVIYCSVTTCSRLDPTLNGYIESGLYFKMMFTGIRGDNRRGSRLRTDYLWSVDMGAIVNKGLLSCVYANDELDLPNIAAVGIVSRDFIPPNLPHAMPGSRHYWWNNSANTIPDGIDITPDILSCGGPLVSGPGSEQSGICKTDGLLDHSAMLRIGSRDYCYYYSTPPAVVYSTGGFSYNTGSVYDVNDAKGFREQGGICHFRSGAVRSKRTDIGSRYHSNIKNIRISRELILIPYLIYLTIS